MLSLYIWLLSVLCCCLLVDGKTTVPVKPAPVRLGDQARITVTPEKRDRGSHVKPQGSAAVWRAFRWQHY